MFLKARALVTYYDEVVLAGLLMAQEDLSRGNPRPAAQDEVGTALRTVVSRLGTLPTGRTLRSGKEAGNSENLGRLDAIGPIRQVAATVLRPADSRPRWQAAGPCSACRAGGPFDEAATR